MNKTENKKAIESLKEGFAGISSMHANMEHHNDAESLTENSGTFGGWSFISWWNIPDISCVW